MKGIDYGRFIRVYQSQDGNMYYNKFVGMRAQDGAGKFYRR
jgi:hypothetical protein